MSERLRLGQIPFLNSFPLHAGMVGTGTIDTVELVGPADLDDQFRKAHRLYWNRRVQWAGELMRNDPELFRSLVPCDPVVTVAPDCVFFECFSKDESAYSDRPEEFGFGDELFVAIILTE